MNACPKAGERRRLLEHFDIEPGLLQQRGGGCPTQTCTDDCDFLPTRMGMSPLVLMCGQRFDRLTI